MLVNANGLGSHVAVIDVQGFMLDGVMGFSYVALSGQGAVCALGTPTEVGHRCCFGSFDQLPNLLGQLVSRADGAY